jgi:hypothetical protein
MWPSFVDAGRRRFHHKPATIPSPSPLWGWGGRTPRNQFSKQNQSSTRNQFSLPPRGGGPGWGGGRRAPPLKRGARTAAPHPVCAACRPPPRPSPTRWGGRRKRPAAFALHATFALAPETAEALGPCLAWTSLWWRGAGCFACQRTSWVVILRIMERIRSGRLGS